MRNSERKVSATRRCASTKLTYVKPVDQGAMAFALVGISIPNFWLGLLLLLAPTAAVALRRRRRA